LRGHDGPVFTLAPLSAGMLASGGQDGSVRIWDTATGRSTVLDRHDQRVGKVRASPDGHLLASTSMDGTMRVRNLRENRYQSRFAHDATFVSLRFSPDGSMLAYGDNRGRFCISNLHIARLICVPGHAGYVADLLFSPTQHELASNNGELRLWDTETMREQSVPLAPAPLSVWLQNRTNLAPQHIMKERGKQ
jgi:WD40 repeat protein